jgi:hypothetical protein
LTLLDGNIILKVTVAKMEALKDSNLKMTYGVLENESEINCKVALKALKTIKLESDKMEEKPIFKQNFNF